MPYGAGGAGAGKVSSTSGPGIIGWTVSAGGDGAKLGESLTGVEESQVWHYRCRKPTRRPTSGGRCDHSAQPGGHRPVRPEYDLR